MTDKESQAEKLESQNEGKDGKPVGQEIVTDEEAVEEQQQIGGADIKGKEEIPSGKEALEDIVTEGKARDASQEDASRETPQADAPLGESPEEEPSVEEPAEESPEEEPSAEEPAEESPEEEPSVEEPAEESPEEEPSVEEPAEESPEEESSAEEPAEESPEEEPTKEKPAEEKTEQDTSGKGPGDDLPPLGQDYTNSSKEELVATLRLLLDRRTIQEIRKEVETIKSAFYKKHRIEIDDKRKKFLESGGSPEEFQPPPDPLEEEYKELYENYRIRRTEYYKVLEEEKGENLKKKREVIDQIENLINSQESLNRTFNEFRELQRQWREIGPVPQSSLRQLWENYHYHVEKFYDFIKINKELRDLDLKKNLEKKLELCEKAETLLLEPSIIKAFKDLQELHSAWRETGPVPIEKKEELWDRFKEATTKINKNHQEHFQKLKGEQKVNLDAKVRLCEQVEEILEKEITSPRKWNDYSRKIIELQKLWRTIGFAPKRENNKVYDRFRKACDTFFNNKREYFRKHRDIQDTNLQLKNELCSQAEALSESAEWKQATEELISLQKEWKNVGPVPRKYSDALWKRFRTACDTFFQRKNEHFQGQDSEQIENLKNKQAIIDELKDYQLSNDHNKDLERLQKFQNQFLAVGHVPFNKKDNLVKEFRKIINELFDKLDIDETKRELLRFRQKIDNLAQSPSNKNRIESEREKLVSKLKQIENDVVLWENNIGFFAKSKKSDSLKKEVDRKIEMAKERITILQEKINIIDNFDY